MKPVLLWLRRGDLRLHDNPALVAATSSGRPVIPVFLRDASVERLGAAPRWRLEQSLRALSETLEQRGSRLVLRSGQALAAIARETGADTVFLTRQVERGAIEEDRARIDALERSRLALHHFPANLLFDAGRVTTGQGGAYKVFTPFWRAVRGRTVAPPLPSPEHLPAPAAWPVSERLDDWRLGGGVKRGGRVLARHVASGEAAAHERLGRFLESAIEGYDDGRDRMDRDGTSGLGAFLAVGEISARQCWHAAMRVREAGNAGAEAFLRQLAWRDFAWHFSHVQPLVRVNDSFAWDRREDRPEVIAWKQGRTGIPLVDAGMRQMHVTGTMHNRARMVVASFLSKNLLADWRIGLRWFAEHLVDWDEANNALGWQWVAGVGPFSAPFHRIFNPQTQAEKFDSAGCYRMTWIAEGQGAPPATALDFYEAVPEGWGMSPQDAYPEPVVDHGATRRAALDRWAARHERFSGAAHAG